MSLKKQEKQEKLMQVLEYIQQFIADNGYPPTIREVGKHNAIKSTATVYNYIAELKERGYLNKTDNKKRAVSIKSKSVAIPLIGTVTAGQPIFAYENYEDYYSLPENEFEGSDLFLLRVQGKSMINAGIFDGDKIVVKKQAYAQDGEIVVALIDDSATVKRFFRQGNKIILHPENEEYSDIVVDEARILGKVVGLIRKF